MGENEREGEREKMRERTCVFVCARGHLDIDKRSVADSIVQEEIGSSIKHVCIDKRSLVDDVFDY